MKRSRELQTATAKKSSHSCLIARLESVFQEKQPQLTSPNNTSAKSLIQILPAMLSARSLHAVDQVREEEAEKVEMSVVTPPGNAARPGKLFINTCLPSVTELSPRKRLVGNDIIISSFGINCYRLRTGGNGARAVIYEVPCLSPGPGTQLELLQQYRGLWLSNESRPTHYHQVTCWVWKRVFPGGK